MSQTDIRTALNEKGGFQIWWRLLRPHTLTASFIPVSVGTMLAYLDGTIDWPLFISMLLAAMLIQAATNMFNEYYDYKRGLDNEQSVGIGGTIVRDKVPPKTVLKIAYSFYLIAILLGIYICYSSSWWVALIGLFGMAIGYFYTGGPIPIAYTPFGEIFSGVLMGTVILFVSYYIHTLTIPIYVVWVSLPLAIFIACIMLANNIRDLDGDKENGRKTVAILLGRERAIDLLATLMIIAYLSTIIFILIDLLPVLSMITLLSAKKAYDVIKGFRGKTKPIEMLPAMIATGQTNTAYGLLLVISLLISRLII